MEKDPKKLIELLRDARKKNEYVLFLGYWSILSSLGNTLEGDDLEYVVEFANNIFHDKDFAGEHLTTPDFIETYTYTKFRNLQKEIRSYFDKYFQRNGYQYALSNSAILNIEYDELNEDDGYYKNSIRIELVTGIQDKMFTHSSDIDYQTSLNIREVIEHINSLIIKCNEFLDRSKVQRIPL